MILLALWYWMRVPPSQSTLVNCLWGATAASPPTNGAPSEAARAASQFPAVATPVGVAPSAGAAAPAARYASTLPKVGVALLAHWDANHTPSITETTSTSFLRWLPAEGMPDKWTLRASSATPARRTVNAQPGVFVPLGAMLGTTVKMQASPKYTPYVFVVFTLHDPTPPASPSAPRTVVGMHRGDDPKDARGSLLRVNSERFGPVVAGMHTNTQSLLATWWGPYVPVADTTYVYGFHYGYTGDQAVLKRLPADSGNALPLPGIDTVDIPPFTNAASEFTVGGIRTPGMPMSETDNGQDNGHCTVHEIVLYDGTLSDADAKAVYKSLRAKWRVTTPAVAGA